MEAAGAVFLVDLFEIDETYEAGLVAAWEAARAFLQSKDKFMSAELYRSVGPHSPFRLAHIVEVESVDTWRQLIADPEFPLPEFPLQNHPGLYEVVHRDDGARGVVVVNAFDVPADADEASFTTPWHRINDFMTERPGHRGARLLRCVGPADYRYVAISDWDSQDAFADTMQCPGFAEIAPEMPYDNHTCVCEVIRN